MNRSSIEFLLEDLSSYGTREAVIWKGQRISYARILQGIEECREQIRDIPSGAIVGIEGDFSPKSISLLFALIEKSAIIVPLDISQRERNADKYRIAQLDFLIRLQQDDTIAFIEVEPQQEKNILYNEVFKAGDPGLVLFTSGSSGAPKAALHNFAKLLAKFKVKRKALRTINFLLFDHWGGLNTLFHILANGGTVVILENRVPDYVCQVIEKHGVELLPTSPTFLNMLLLSRAYERHSLASLKLITYGAEPMPEALLKNLTRTFPHIGFQQTYGLIELGVMRSKSEDNGSLWVKIGGEGFAVRVVDDMLQIKSDSAMVGYLNAPSPFTPDGWFMTGDAVEQKDEYFRILGRKSELINVGGEKVFPQEIENIILEIPDIEDVLVYGEPHPFTGKIVCAKIKYIGQLSSQEIVTAVKKHCREKLASFKVPVKVLLQDKSFESGRFKKSRVDVK